MLTSRSRHTCIQVKRVRSPTKKTRAKRRRKNLYKILPYRTEPYRTLGFHEGVAHGTVPYHTVQYRTAITDKTNTIPIYICLQIFKSRLYTHTGGWIRWIRPTKGLGYLPFQIAGPATQLLLVHCYRSVVTNCYYYYYYYYY